ncbi:hypothetical protein TRFO_32844 [Tritrichomonas foetus]|uniref:Uncharacterized protein n=1 Tax=Tritrichomonas foetus TaxID=1144522 RepID=A0A1J4JMY0_9EUKA|nr:hypothetical protein TRFO_32844 [Tritrichomonas foetus]|eukprot:OHT00479.1 hypothetical protein TRFO_32844 [Tritrichomonas foetus]
MPPRGATKKATRRATKTTRPQRGRGKSMRGGRKSKIENQQPEEKPPEAEEKPKKESWLDNLPPVIKPDEELHQKLSKERRERRAAKVHQYCSLEIQGMLEFAFRSMKIERDFINSNNEYQNIIDSQKIIIKEKEKDKKKGKNMKKGKEDTSNNNEVTKERKLRQLHSDFRNGLLTPQPESPVKEVVRNECSVKVEPIFSLEVQNYLRFSSDSMWKDLSTFFNCDLNEKYIHDPDTKFNEFLEYLQQKMALFQNPYHPFDKIYFPFIICITGPQGTGRTTICQLLQKVYNVTIIEVLPPTPSDNLIRKKKNQTIEPEVEPLPEYPLLDIIQIKAMDDNSTANMIAQNIHDQKIKGTIIVGWPNSKTQLAQLEKEINKQNTLSKTASRLSIDSLQSGPKSKTPIPNIQGIIITLNPNSSREKLLDPVTGNVYQEDFYLPGFLDFYDELPTNFLKKKEEIQNRLIIHTVPEFPPVTNKVVARFNTFESMTRKTYSTLVIPKCDTIDQLCKYLDMFIDTIFKKANMELSPSNPLFALAHPKYLVKPGLCYNAMLSWRDCLDEFGPIIADQSNLVSILGNRLDQMLVAAIDRFTLYTCHGDSREEKCKRFMNCKDQIDFSDFFKDIWNLSLKSRDDNLSHTKEIVEKSGFLELVVELRKTPKLIFIALIRRLYYTSWFYKTFYYLFKEPKPKNKSMSENLSISMQQEEEEEQYFCSFLDEFCIDRIFPPKISILSSRQIQLVKNMSTVCLFNPANPTQQTSHKANIYQSQENFAESNSNHENKQQSNVIITKSQFVNDLLAGKVADDFIFFDQNRVVNDFNVPPFSVIDCPFSDTLKFADKFFNHLLQNIDNQKLFANIKSSLLLFKNFSIVVKKKETVLVDSIDQLNHDISEIAYQKCSQEMESFSKKFRTLREGKTLDSDLFEYNFSRVRNEILHLARYSIKHQYPIIAQNIVSFSTVLKIAQILKSKEMTYCNVHTFLQVLETLDIDEEESNALELSLRIFVCSECFSIQKLLLCFIKYPEEEEIIKQIFPDMENLKLG